jgi:anti-sigma regulatory factor (Ser/Thr protein kinase)
MEAAAGSVERSGREFASATESIGAAREFIRESMASALVGEETVGDILLAISELVTNAVVHGNGEPITVEIDTSSPAIVCSVASGFSGRPLPDPATWTSPDQAGPTGRGLSIVRAVADAVVVDIDDSIMTVRCTFVRR